MSFGDLAEQREQPCDIIAGQPVVDTNAFAGGVVTKPARLSVCRCTEAVVQIQPLRLGQSIYTPLTVGEQIQQLQPPSAGQPLTARRERLIQLRF
jgi:hypothetical protein